jgi:protein involved in polysaccharide export with SLBB domain
VGRVFVAGKNIEEAENSVKKALESTQLRKASVMVEPIQGQDVESGPVVYLAGEFRTPRAYRLVQGVTPTLVGVILSSGGVTEKADLTRVKVMRVANLRGVVEEVNVQRIIDGGGLTSDVTLNDGDVVVIPTGSANVIYLTGRVKRQGALPMKLGEKLNAYAAILQTGGFERFAKETGVYILRAMPDGTKQKIRVNVSAIKRGQAPDVPLQSNDIIVVPEKFFSF